ncbi:peptide chain release factor N(5)-glutamine methyltransferase [Gaetbulibacter saemankumensis]|uniref:peptide chain release factor N(5)-glutamine methyltransferase n=1 Tax=Gaetbulibacter saemankumensis TaxID=311208 RepID=UPI0004276F9F|nr:peptide chain release factor N(5)-glutamine methyltransferase [Gaetbulibacter saemankumensis]
MKVKELQHTFHQELDVHYDKEEVDSFFFMLLSYWYHIERIKLALEPNLILEDDSKMFKALDRLKKQQPIQYILGETEFFGLPFKVTEFTLIPRPETEELVEWIVNHQGEFNKKMRIIDIGTGSGCIAISLAKNIPNAEVFGLDVSADALKIARQNADLNKVNVHFMEANILDSTTWPDVLFQMEFDVIVSNPPYVRELEKSLMKANVLDHEPHLALFVKDEDPLVFYKAITQFATKKLTDKGALFFEINEYLGNEMIHLLTENKFKNILLKQDMFKKDRMIKGEKN